MVVQGWWCRLGGADLVVQAWWCRVGVPRSSPHILIKVFSLRSVTPVSAVPSSFPPLRVTLVNPRSFSSIPTRPGRNPNFRISQFCPQNPFFGIPRSRFLTFFDQKSPPTQPKNMISQIQPNIILRLFVMFYIVIETFHRPQPTRFRPKIEKYTNSPYVTDMHF